MTPEQKQQILGGVGKIRWKPRSENDGNLVVLTGNRQPVSLVNQSGDVVARGSNRGASNGYASTVRFGQPGHTYGDVDLRIGGQDYDIPNERSNYGGRFGGGITPIFNPTKAPAKEGKTADGGRGSFSLFGTRTAAKVFSDTYANTKSKAFEGNGAASVQDVAAHTKQYGILDAGSNKAPANLTNNQLFTKDNKQYINIGKDSALNKQFGAIGGTSIKRYGNLMGAYNHTQNVKAGENRGGK